MTASATRTLPDHGTTARYSGDRRTGKTPCNCGRCALAGRRARKRRKLVGPLTTNTRRVRQHLQNLIAADATCESIAAAAPCDVGVVKYILNGTRHTVRASTAARLLAVADAPDGYANVDATGSIRRVRALMAIGHRCTAISEASGLSHRIVSELVNARCARVQRRTVQATARAFDALSMTVGTSVQNRNRAVREGWAPPLAWMDVDITDPASEPSGHVPVRRTSAELAEDSDELLRLGVPLDVIASRHGVSLNTLMKARERTAARERAAATAATQPT